MSLELDLEVVELLSDLTPEEDMQLSEILEWGYKNKNKISLSRLAEICGVFDLTPIRMKMGEDDFIIEGSETFLTNWEIISLVFYMGTIPCLVKARARMDKLNGK